MFLKIILLSLFSVLISADCTTDPCPIPSVCCVANGLCVSNQDQCTACNPYDCPSGCCKGDSCASSCGSGDGPSALIFIGVVIAIIVVIVLASLCTKAFYNPPPRMPAAIRIPQQDLAGQQAQPIVAPPYSIPIIEVAAVPKDECAKDFPQRQEEEQIFEVAEELNNSEVARHLQKNKQDMIKTALEMQEILVDQGVPPDPRDKIPKS